MKIPEPLSHAYLITGGSEERRSTLAGQMAAAYLCTGENIPCGRCRPCRKVAGNIHPDVVFLSPLPDKKEITVDQTRTLRADVYIRPNEGKRKIYVISPADSMNDHAQNALLKVLEDGPEYAAFLLLAAEAGKLLDTVRSRCEILALPPEEEEPDPEKMAQAEKLAELLLQGDELAVAEGLIPLEIQKIKSAQLTELLILTERCVAARLISVPRRGAEVLRVLKQCREDSIYNPGTGHIIGRLSAELFR